MMLEVARARPEERIAERPACGRKRRRLRWPWGTALGCLAAVAIFWPCLRYGFAMDDFALIEAGRAPLSVGLPAHFVPHPGIHYRPLGQYGYFWLADRLFGMEPLPFHVANLALHLANVLLAGRLIRKLVPDPLAAGLATLYFATHSALFLVIAWAALAGEAIPLFFMLAALGYYARSLEGGRAGWWLGALAATVAALLSKQVAVALPPALILYQVVFHPAKGRAGGWRLPLIGPSVALLAPLAAYAWFVLRVSGPHESGAYRLVVGPGAVRTGLTYGVWALDLPRVLIAPGVAMLVVAASWLLALAAYAAWRRDRVLLFGLGWFGLFLAPVLFLPQHMFHYYLYAPLFGAALVLARLGELALAGVRSRQVRAVVATTLALALLLGNATGVVEELRHNPTMAQAEQGRRALAVLRSEHPDPQAGAGFHFVAPADHIYYVLGYGAAVRLAYDGTPVRVTFEGLTPGPGGEPVYRYRWTGETIEAVR